MMIPLRNGVVLNSEEYGCSYRADVYQLDDEWWIFRYNTNPMAWDEKPHFVVQKMHHKFEGLDVHATMIVHERDLILTDRGHKSLGVEADG